MKIKTQAFFERNKLLCLVLSLFLFSGPSLKANGTITDGGSTINFITNSAFDNFDWEWEPGGDNHTFEISFYYRIDGESSETRLVVPDGELFVNNTATLNWKNVDGKNFDVQLTFTLTDYAGSSSFFSSDVAVTNNTGSPLDIEIFKFYDIEKGGGVAADIAKLIAPNQIEVADIPSGDLCIISGIEALAFEVHPNILFPNDFLRIWLNDASITTFTNGGLPLLPPGSDFHCAFQWTLSIPISGTENVVATIAGNPPAPTIPTLSQWGNYGTIHDHVDLWIGGP